MRLHRPSERDEAEWYENAAYGHWREPIFWFWVPDSSFPLKVVIEKHAAENDAQDHAQP